MSSPNAPQPTGPQPLGERADRQRVDHDVFHVQNHVLDEVADFRTTARTLLDPHAGHNFDRVVQRETRQLRESGREENPDLAREAELTALLANADPVRVRRAVMDRLLQDRTIHDIQVPGATPPILDAQITYRNGHRFWESSRTSQEIYNAILGRNQDQLHDLGIDIPITNAIALPEAPARALAAQLSIPFLRSGDKGISEANMGMMQLMLLRHPELLQTLVPPDTTADVARLRAEARLRSLVHRLEAMSISPDKNRTDVEYEITNFGTVSSPEERAELNKLTKESRQYAEYAAQLSAIEGQINTMGLTVPAALTPLLANLANLQPAQTPLLIAGQLVTNLGQIMDEPKTAAPTGPAPQLVGVEAVLRVYDRFYQKHFTVLNEATGLRELVPLDAESARARSLGLFMKNEKTSVNSHFIDHEVEHIAGGHLTPLQSFVSETKAFFKRFGTSGSDEAKIIAIAEKVGIPRGAGTVIIDNAASQTVNTAGWATAGVAGAAVLGATSWPALLAAGVAVPLVNAVARRVQFGNWTRAFFPMRWRGLGAGSLAQNFSNLTGTRVMGILPFARFHASPTWGRLRNNPEALTAALADIDRNIKAGRLTNTPYVQQQIDTILHMLMDETHQGVAEGLSSMELTAENIKAITIDNIRASTMKDVRETLAGINNPNASANQKHLTHAAQEASDRVGAKRQAAVKPIKDWLNKVD